MPALKEREALSRIGFQVSPFMDPSGTARRSGRHGTPLRPTRHVVQADTARRSGRHGTSFRLTRHAVSTVSPAGGWSVAFKNGETSPMTTTDVTGLTGYRTCRFPAWHNSVKPVTSVVFILAVVLRRASMRAWEAKGQYPKISSSETRRTGAIPSRASMSSSFSSPRMR